MLEHCLLEVIRDLCFTDASQVYFAAAVAQWSERFFQCYKNGVQIPAQQIPVRPELSIKRLLIILFIIDKGYSLMFLGNLIYTMQVLHYLRLLLPLIFISFLESFKYETTSVVQKSCKYIDTINFPLSYGYKYCRLLRLSKPSL